MKHYVFLILIIILYLGGCSKNNHTTISPDINNTTSVQVTLTPSITNESPNMSNNKDTVTPTTSVKSTMDDIVNSIKSNSLDPLTIDENSYYVISGNNWYDSSANITIINNKKEIVRTFNQVIINSPLIGKINKNEPFIIGIYDYSTITTNDNHDKYSKEIYGTSYYKYGLYLPSTNSYLIEPIYDSLIQYDDNIFGAYLDDKIIFLDKNGNSMFSPIDNTGINVTVTSNTIWLISREKSTYVYDKNFNQIKEIDSTNTTFYSFGDEYIFSNNNVGYMNQRIYDSYGTPILTKEILLEHSDIPKDILSLDVDFYLYRDSNIPLFKVSIGNYELLLDDNYHVIDTIDTLETPSYNFFTSNNYYSKYNYTNRNEIILHRADGSIVLDEYGQHFSEALSDTVFSRINNNVLTIYNSETKESYSITLENYTFPSLTSLTPELFFVLNGDEPYLFSIYYKDKLILRSSNHGYSYNPIDDNYFAFRETDFNDYSSIYTIIDSFGNVKYTSLYKEILITADKDYLLVQRGNYIGLVDYNGNFVFKILNPSLIND